MKLINIENLKFIEGFIFYIKDFTANAIIADDSDKVTNIMFDFSIEYRPLGDIIVKIKTQNDMLEAVKDQLVKHIHVMEENGDFVNR